MRQKFALMMMAALLLSSFMLPAFAQTDKQTKNKQTTTTTRARKPSDLLKVQDSTIAQDMFAEMDADLKMRVGSPTNAFRAEYLRRRDEAISRLHGYPLPPNVTGNPRAEGIRQLERQEAALRQQNSILREAGARGPQINSTSWTQIGPAPIPGGQTSGVSMPVSGRVLAIAVHPSNPNIVYVGTAQGGLYRSLDGGATWVAIMDNALSMVIGAIAIDPNDPTNVFVGTGEGNFAGGNFFGVGLYRIRNADTKPILEGPFNTSTNTSNGLMANSRSICKIIVNPNDSNIIFVGTGSGAGSLPDAGSVGPNTSQRGLFRSVNALSANPTFQKLNVNGATGTGTNPGLNTAVRDIEFEPGNPNILLAGVDDSIGGGTDGVWRTTNALAADHTTITFTKTLAGVCAFCNTQIAVSKTLNITTVYAALESANGGEVYKSVNGGATFAPAPLPTSLGFCGGQCFYDMPIAADPTNANNVLIGGSGDYDALQTPNKRSVDGTNFVKASTGLHPDSHDIVYAPSNPLVVYHGNDGGVWRSNDGGATWNSLNNTGFSATQFVDISTHPTDRNFMIGGTQDNGTPFLQPENTWKLGDFGDGGYSVIDQNATDTNNVTSYHTYFNSPGQQVGFVRANNRSEIDPGALGWPTAHGCFGGSQTAAQHISCTDTTLFYAPMAQGPGNPNTLYFGAQKLYRSTDRGDNMPAVSQLFATAVSAIGISQQNDNVRLVGLANGGLFGTSTGATTMVNLDAGNTVPNTFITRAIIDPNDTTAPYTAYVTLNAYGLAAGAHVYKTTNLADSGTTWTLSGTGIPDVPTNTIVVDPQNSNNLYAGTDIGVYRSTNAGASWQPFSEGLPRVAVFDMEFQARNDPSIRVLRIATHGRGIWQISVAPIFKQRADFDTDGKSDVSIWRGSTGQWFIINSMGGFRRIEADWGRLALGDIAVPRDYDGDNKVDVAVWRPSDGNWYILQTSKQVVSNTPTVRNWGQSGDIPVPGDYDGDGKADLAVFRPNEGNWYIVQSSNNSTIVRGWGLSTDKLVPADYDNDGKTDIAVWRESDGNWYIINSGSNSVTVRSWGVGGDKPVPADYDGDSKDDIAIFRPAEANWYIINSSTNTITVKSWGNPTDVPVPADYDGDGKSDIAVYRSNEGNWFILQSNTNTGRLENLGGAGGDQPTPATYTYLPQ
jgi:FG-GAP-like repeat